MAIDMPRLNELWKKSLTQGQTQSYDDFKNSLPKLAVQCHRYELDLVKRKWLQKKQVKEDCREIKATYRQMNQLTESQIEKNFFQTFLDDPSVYRAKMPNYLQELNMIKINQRLAKQMLEQHTKSDSREERVQSRA